MRLPFGLIMRMFTQTINERELTNKLAESYPMRRLAQLIHYVYRQAGFWTDKKLTQIEKDPNRSTATGKIASAVKSAIKRKL